MLIPKVLASSNLGLKLANAFGVFFKLNQYERPRSDHTYFQLSFERISVNGPRDCDIVESGFSQPAVTSFE